MTSQTIKKSECCLMNCSESNQLKKLLQRSFYKKTSSHWTLTTNWVWRALFFNQDLSIQIYSQKWQTILRRISKLSFHPPKSSSSLFIQHVDVLKLQFIFVCFSFHRQTFSDENPASNRQQNLLNEIRYNFQIFYWWLKWENYESTCDIHGNLLSVVSLRI